MINCFLIQGKIMDEITFDLAPELKLACLEVASNFEGSTQDQILSAAKMFYEWVSEPLKSIEVKKNVFEIVKSE